MLIPFFNVPYRPCYQLVSFKLYDVDHAGYITRPGLERAMTQLVGILRRVFLLASIPHLRTLGDRAIEMCLRLLFFF